MGIKSKTTTPSLTDWLKIINVKRSDSFLFEDNNKYERLGILNKLIQIPYPPPLKLEIEDINNKTEKLDSALQKFNNKQCFLRLTSLNPENQKIRRKGGTLENNLRWFKKQNIDTEKYRIEIIPRCPNVILSGIFIVDDNRIWGEVARGGISQLVSGKYKKKPLLFSYDLDEWNFSSKNFKKEQKILERVFNKIKVTNSNLKKSLTKKLNAEFNENGFIKGYFEFTLWPKEGIKFVDYNRIQIKYLKNFDVKRAINSRKEEIYGICASPGKTKGKIRIVKQLPEKKFKKGEILVCKMININHVPLMRQANAIITEKGTMLCHGAVISRELKKPYLVMVDNATKKLKDGMSVSIDAQKGLIEILK